MDKPEQIPLKNGVIYVYECGLDYSLYRSLGTAFVTARFKEDCLVINDHWDKRVPVDRIERVSYSGTAPNHPGHFAISDCLSQLSVLHFFSEHSAPNLNMAESMRMSKELRQVFGKIHEMTIARKLAQKERFGQEQGLQICPWCHLSIIDLDPIHSCPECQTQSHDTCYHYHGVCTTLACSHSKLDQSREIFVKRGSLENEDPDLGFVFNRDSISLWNQWRVTLRDNAVEFHADSLLFLMRTLIFRSATAVLIAVFALLLATAPFLIVYGSVVNQTVRICVFWVAAVHLIYCLNEGPLAFFPTFGSIWLENISGWLNFVTFGYFPPDSPELAKAKAEQSKKEDSFASQLLVSKSFSLNYLPETHEIQFVRNYYGWKHATERVLPVSKDLLVKWESKQDSLTVELFHRSDSLFKLVDNEAKGRLIEKTLRSWGIDSQPVNSEHELQACAPVPVKPQRSKQQLAQQAQTKHSQTRLKTKA